jgi:FtsP/CotA-like multicopper oxidase with cupredoxin domain
MVHEPSAGTLAEYARAIQVQPDEGCSVIDIALEAREIEWEFMPGLRTRAWGYNGTVPGPVIEAAVGDVLQVHLHNSLPEPTMIHWHGMRLPPPMDGTENVQRPIEPGGSFVYRFVLRDAGTFWYHPHINETVQLERGLYGALIVRGPKEPTVDAERVLILDDVALDDSGQIAESNGWAEKHDGRQGSVVLLNGRNHPQLQLSAGQVERWRIINAASARYVRLSLESRPFAIIGTDGGLIPAPFSANEVLLAPGDRIDIAAGPFAEGDAIRVESLEYPRGTIAPAQHATFATVHVGPPAPTRAHIPDVLREIVPLVSEPAAPTREVRLGYRPTQTEPAFTINDESHHRAALVKLGELQVWDIINDSTVDHPFHLHGYFFQVVAVDNVRPPFLSWEDTVNVPAGSRVRIAWRADDRPGEWMYHCHILEHHAGGMMAHFEVVP